MRKYSLRERLKSGSATLGSFLGLGSPHAAGLMAHAGLDWLVIETEHNSMDLSQVEHAIMAFADTDTVPFVRVPPRDLNYIQRVLDFGARGIVVPLTKTVEDVRAVISATRYPPEGTRGFGPLRASQYTFANPDYFREINEQITIVLILETREALENLDEIAALPGVDGLFVGQCDMCLSMGLHPLKFNEYPEIDAAIARALEMGRKHNVAVGLNVQTPDMLRKRLDEGHRFLSYGPEYALLGMAIKQGVEAFRRRGA